MLAAFKPCVAACCLPGLHQTESNQTQSRPPAAAVCCDALDVDAMNSLTFLGVIGLLAMRPGKRRWPLRISLFSLPDTKPGKGQEDPEEAL